MTFGSKMLRFSGGLISGCFDDLFLENLQRKKIAKKGGARALALGKENDQVRGLNFHFRVIMYKIRNIEQAKIIRVYEVAF